MSIKIENTQGSGWEAAIRGARNPMNSWEKSDSWFVDYWDAHDECYGVHTIFGRHAEMQDTNEKTVGGSPLMDISWFDKDGNPCKVTVPWHDSDDSEVILGFSDHKLLMNLCKGGTEESKWRRMVHVSMDVTAPLYWWKEFETYKVGTVSNSCSTMHKIHAKEFTLDDFSCEHLIKYPDNVPEFKSEYSDEERIDELNWFSDHDAYDTDLDWDSYGNAFIVVNYPHDLLKEIIKALNHYREKFLETKDKKYWYQLIQLLPSSYNQRRTIDLNYEVLASQYRQRKEHKLDDWHRYCNWIRSLPYSEFITMEE